MFYLLCLIYTKKCRNQRYVDRTNHECWAGQEYMIRTLPSGLGYGFGLKKRWNSRFGPPPHPNYFPTIIRWFSKFQFCTEFTRNLTEISITAAYVHRNFTSFSNLKSPINRYIPKQIKWNYLNDLYCVRLMTQFWMRNESSFLEGLRLFGSRMCLRCSFLMSGFQVES